MTPAAAFLRLPGASGDARYASTDPARGRPEKSLASYGLQWLKLRRADASVKLRRAMQLARTVRHRATTTDGFTLIELLVVLAILGLLIGLVAPPVIKYLGRAKTDVAKVDIRNIESSLDLFRLDIGRYPTQQEGLKALVEKPPGLDRWQGPYIKQKAVPTDPWGHPYHYRVPGEHGDFDLYSLGADDAPGGTGENQDITNW